MEQITERLYAILQERKKASPESSYVASLYAKGKDAILKKVGEEATEVLLAAKNGDRKNLIHELADLRFHNLVLMAHEEILPEEIDRELASRFGISGHEEKKQRKLKQ